MKAGVLSIGDELMVGQTVDTNGPWLSSAMAALGVTTVERRTVDDDRAAIASALRDLVAIADVVVVTGGIGPTADDLTRIGLCDVVDPGSELVCDDEALAQVRHWFEGRGRKMPRANVAQAMRPPSAQMLVNRHGTAPGLAASSGGATIFVLPGPPREMRPMFEEHVQSALGGDRADRRNRFGA